MMNDICCPNPCRRDNCQNGGFDDSSWIWIIIAIIILFCFCGFGNNNNNGCC